MILNKYLQTKSELLQSTDEIGARHIDVEYVPVGDADIVSAQLALV